jgi:hypothetical protein
MSDASKITRKRASFRNVSPPSLEPPIEEVLANVSPQVNRYTAERQARVGELQTILTNISLHSSHGCTRILFNIHYTSTIDELARRGFELELYDRQPGWVISWEEDPPSLEEILGEPLLPPEAGEVRLDPKADRS